MLVWSTLNSIESALWDISDMWLVLVFTCPVKLFIVLVWVDTVDFISVAVWLIVEMLFVLVVTCPDKLFIEFVWLSTVEVILFAVCSIFEMLVVLVFTFPVKLSIEFIFCVTVELMLLYDTFNEAISSFVWVTFPFIVSIVLCCCLTLRDISSAVWVSLDILFLFVSIPLSADCLFAVTVAVIVSVIFNVAPASNITGTIFVTSFTYLFSPYTNWTVK